MKNLPKLIDAVCTAFSNALPGMPWSPRMDNGEFTTFCNQGFNYICLALSYKSFGSLEKTLTANQIYNAMNDPNGDWMDIGDPKVIQYHANDGVLCAAIWKNIFGHGHVCTVMPGELEFSNSWGAMSPKVMNIGKDVFIGKKASFAFQKENLPRYFALKRDL